MAAKSKTTKLRSQSAKLKPKIESDGEIIWVNGQVCLARFSEKVGEVFLADGGTAATYSTDLRAMWELWVAQVKAHHDFEVPESARPAFVPPAEEE